MWEVYPLLRPRLDRPVLRRATLPLHVFGVRLGEAVAGHLDPGPLLRAGMLAFCIMIGLAYAFASRPLLPGLRLRLPARAGAVPESLLLRLADRALLDRGPGPPCLLGRCSSVDRTCAPRSCRGGHSGCSEPGRRSCSSSPRHGEVERGLAAGRAARDVDGRADGLPCDRTVLRRRNGSSTSLATEGCFSTSRRPVPALARDAMVRVPAGALSLPLS